MVAFLPPAEAAGAPLSNVFLGASLALGPVFSSEEEKQHIIKGRETSKWITHNENGMISVIRALWMV